MIITDGREMRVVLEEAEPMDRSVNDANMEQAAPHKPYGNLTSEQAIRWSNANGLLTVFPAENQLQLDI